MELTKRNNINFVVQIHVYGIRDNYQANSTDRLCDIRLITAACGISIGKLLTEFHVEIAILKPTIPN
ncbi:hypothetical protein [Pedobacter heparinus]|uniref:hypothetical protein n=1 Tax=Pedobacter heparinus TaxID=984 RepID=UPI00055D9CF0|nr:hypothetical protein [Pedobacter heparinus]